MHYFHVIPFDWIKDHKNLGRAEARRAQEGVGLGRNGSAAAKRCAPPQLVAFPFGLSTHPHPQSSAQSVVLESSVVFRVGTPLPLSPLSLLPDATVALYQIVNCVTPTTTNSKGGELYICYCGATHTRKGLTE